MLLQDSFKPPQSCVRLNVHAQYLKNVFWRNNPLPLSFLRAQTPSNSYPLLTLNVFYLFNLSHIPNFAVFGDDCFLDVG